MKPEKSKNVENGIDKKDKLTFPKIISIIGPKKSGKSTLIKTIGYYFNKNLFKYKKGPFLIFNKNKEDFILLESPLDMLSISNLTKVSDIIILVIDGFFGLELETFETIALINSNGTPRVFCVLTNLDLYTNWKNLKKAKKRIKNRLKKELGNQTKVFYLSGLSFNQKYLLREISNITRYFCLTKTWPSLMQTKSAYFLCTKLIVIGKNKGEHLFLKGYLKGEKISNVSELRTISQGFGILGKIRIIKSRTLINAKGIRCKITDKIKEEENDPKKRFRKFINFDKKTVILTSTVIFYFLFFSGIIEKSNFFQKHEKFYESSKLRFRDYLFKKKKNYSLYNSEKLKEKTIDWMTSFQRTSITKTEPKKKEFMRKFFQKKQTRAYSMNSPTSLLIREFSENFLKWFDVSYPLLVIFRNNDVVGNLIEGKILRHKWNKKIIRSREKIYLSVGWNYFKTNVYFFSIKNKKTAILNKSLKKSGYNLICFRSLISFKKAGIIGIYNSISNFSGKSRGVLFNIIFTGYFLGPLLEKKIFKKIKIKGEIFYTNKKTAFITNIFSNEIEVHRFLGNFIIGENKQKGIIKKPLKMGPPGSFRAIFNEHVKKKESVFLRLFVPLKLNDKIILVNYLLNSWDEREIERK
jgi:ribosome biogenesis protein BMS1